MSEVTDGELEAALRDAVDEHGVDQRLARATATMTPGQIRAAEENVRRWIAAVRHSREQEGARAKREGI